MKRSEFEKIYWSGEGKKYSRDVFESVKHCILRYDQIEEAMKIASSQVIISIEDAVKDIQDFCNCLKLCYSGYESLLGDALCEKLQLKMIQKLKDSKEEISNTDLCKLIREAFLPYLKDNHFYMGVYGYEGGFPIQYIAYVTDLVVKKVVDGYIVVKGDENFEPGEILAEKDVKEYLMPTLYVDTEKDILESYEKENHFYLLGKYVSKEILEIDLAGKKVKTHPILSDKARQSNTDSERIMKKKDYWIIHHSNYAMPWNQDLMEVFREEGKECARKDKLILDLTGNFGGCSDYAEYFYDGLAGITSDGFDGAYLHDPVENEDVVKKYDKHVDEVGKEGTYKGHLFVVMNSGTASSGEMGVSISFGIKNAVTVGSATLGCSEYGEVLSYQLTHSKVGFRCGCKRFFHDHFSEGVGFLPDYWIDDEDPVGVVEKYLVTTEL